MSAPGPAAFLICDDAPDAAPTTPSGEQPGARQASETPFDPSRWVMVGWRPAKGGARVVTWQQLSAVLGAAQGPCARCGTPHHRYGVGGQPLCPTCRAAA